MLETYSFSDDQLIDKIRWDNSDEHNAQNVGGGHGPVECGQKVAIVRSQNTKRKQLSITYQVLYEISLRPAFSST